MTKDRDAHPRRRWIGYSVAVLVAIAASSLPLLSPRYLSLADAAMLYLLSVVLVATRFGAGPSILSALIGVAGFDLILPPTFRFSVAEMGHVITLGVMIFVSLLVSGLTERLRREKQRAHENEQRTASLYTLERALSGARDRVSVAREAVEKLDTTIAGKPVLLLRDGPNVRAIDASGARAPTPHELSSLDAAPALMTGLAGETCAIGSGDGGVLILRPDRAFDKAERELVCAFVQRVASALVGIRLATEAEAARLEAQVERVRAALLSSVSHDLRTPLATISASAQMLLRAHAEMDRELRSEMLTRIADEASRLDNLLRNLLAMTRVETGKLRPNLLPASVDEVITGALRSLDHRLAGRIVTRTAQNDLPLVDVDVPLVQQVVINVLENAIRYSPPKTPLSICSRVAAGKVEVTIRDQGIGVDPTETEQIFEKFRRGSNAPKGDGGVGLGLTICRAIVEAHEGAIRVNGVEGGGTMVTVTLPPTKLIFSEAEQHLPSQA